MKKCLFSVLLLMLFIAGSQLAFCLETGSEKSRKPLIKPSAESAISNPRDSSKTAVVGQESMQKDFQNRSKTAVVGQESMQKETSGSTMDKPGTDNINGGGKKTDWVADKPGSDNVNGGGKKTDWVMDKAGSGNVNVGGGKKTDWLMDKPGTDNINGGGKKTTATVGPLDLPKREDLGR